VTAVVAPPSLGRPRLHLRRTDSTNERARELAAGGAPHGTLVTAAEQTAGRGRQGRRWSAPPGSSLLMSLVLRPPPRLLPLAAAVAVCDAIGSDTENGERALIKWPNDIVLVRTEGLAKLAGILVEARPQQRWAVLGVGLNVAVDLEQLPAEIRGLAATMGGRPEDVEPLLARLLAALSARLAEPPDAVLRAWGERDALRGRAIEWDHAQGVTGGEQAPRRSGVAQGIDGEGRLVVALEGGGLTTLGAGEVHLRAGA
jgi:BirA family transcriptional regulator, biotin operon repressor / biotin---[acetyl-CoA-carboxylase] ligase